VLSGEEIRAGGRRQAAQAQERDFTNTWSQDDFASLDRNNDNVLTRAEVVGNEESVPDGFANIDANRDGIISRAEVRGGGVATSGR
jgi:hypothetical protein